MSPQKSPFTALPTRGRPGQAGPDAAGRPPLREAPPGAAAAAPAGYRVLRGTGPSHHFQGLSRRPGSGLRGWAHSARTRAQPGDRLGATGETEATAGEPRALGHAAARVSSAARGVGESRPDPARRPAAPPSTEPEPEPSGQWAGRSPARPPWGRGHASPAPAHWLRRQGWGEAARCWGSAGGGGGGGSKERPRWAEAPLARGPLPRPLPLEFAGDPAGPAGAPARDAQRSA